MQMYYAAIISNPMTDSNLTQAAMQSCKYAQWPLCSIQV